MWVVIRWLIWVNIKIIGMVYRVDIKIFLEGSVLKGIMVSFSNEVMLNIVNKVKWILWMG